MPRNVESRYDEYISPLMAQIIAICHREGIPLAATFQLSDGDAPLYVTTTIPFQWQSERMRTLQVAMAREIPLDR